MQSLCSALLDDLSGYPTLSSRMKSFMQKLKAAEQECYDQWCRETIQAIDDPTDSIALETKGRIMVLEQKRGTLNVNYSDRLIKLLKEVRQLASLGLNIPSKIINCVNQGEKFYRFGVVLKQIAHFYNTIDQQMLPCQQALLLDEAIAFERLVIPRKNEESAISRVTWEDPKELEEFIAKLQGASDKLSNHNRRLRNAHTEIVHMVLELVNLDVLKEVNRWKEILVKIRSKVRNFRYLCNLNYPFFRFLRKKLFMEPPKKACVHGRFIGIGSFIRLVSSLGYLAGKFFATMLGKNASRFPSIYEKAEQLMSTVENVDSQFADWLVLAQVDLEQLIEEKLKTASEWEAQMKLLKMKGREAEKLPNEIRLECIVVSTAGAKSAIDELLQRLFDTLTWTLRLSINTKLQKIQQFLTQAISVLSSRPQSIDEVAEANARHNEYGKTNKEVRWKLLKSSWTVLNEQHTLLRSVAGSGVDQMTSLTQEWEKFELMLDSHQQMIKEQVEVLKSNVDTRVKALNDDAEKLLARWNQFKPKSDALQGDRKALLNAIEFIKEKRAEYDELVVSKEKLEYVYSLSLKEVTEKECDQFDVSKPDFAVLEQLGADIQEYENNWVIFEEFNSELQTLASEEWIVFRSKTYLFDEFLQKWLEKLKASQQTHMGIRLLKDIESFREFSNCLKFCRGEVLSTDHWLEMFRLLQLPRFGIATEHYRGTTLEKLTFGDLISVAPNVVANVEQLKALNARAQGEVTIREAIQELEMWAAQAEFSFSDYKHSNGSIMKVIREWKESINSVSRTHLKVADTLPAEASRFARVDSEFHVVRDARLVSLCNRQSLRKSLELVTDQLNRCQKALNQFLEEKRSAFPRFYFLGDDDLLEILGQSTNPTVIQSHLKKLFQGIDKVVFGPGNETISAVLSAQGEVVQLSRPVRVVAQVEVSWVMLSPATISSSTQCWTWQKQLRFYVVGDGVVARQVNSEFAYTYEYQVKRKPAISSTQRIPCFQGNTPKLVHTPLTDKCYLTLTQAMSMGLGGNPYGPAGTGKTESVKVVLRGCGDLRASKPDASETEIVVQALLLNTLSKLTSSDSKRFNVLIDDIFSTVNKEMATRRGRVCKGNSDAVDEDTVR
ncbi:dynein heavy chain, region 2 [Ancylostoma duodenale]|uniref:Dynein heavy chain, region 2 n=1 Tax=Ancylostoma duodenale TaxID=51022 RepID=A0A0C2DF35_9BILA|nr:dynein heavy chain, region 2 [Ancylostoma duodenale]